MHFRVAIYVIAAALALTLSSCARQESGLWHCVYHKAYNTGKEPNGYTTGAIIDFDQAYFRESVTESYDTGDPQGFAHAARQIYESFENDDLSYERIRFIDSDELRIRFVLSDSSGDEVEQNSYIKRSSPNALKGQAGISENGSWRNYYDCFKQPSITLEEVISIAKDRTLPTPSQ